MGLTTSGAAASSSSYPAEGRPFPSGGTKGYSIPGVDIYGVGTSTPSTQQIRYQPIFVVSSISVDQIACDVNTAATLGTNCRMGIYTADTNWQPTTLVADSGDVAVNSGTGIKSASISATLTAGRYLMAMMTDASNNVLFRTWRGGTRYGQFLSGLGANPVNDLWFVSTTFGAYNATPVAWTQVNGSGGSPGMLYYCVLRVSTP